MTPRARKINAAQMPTMPAMCKTCPFSPQGDKALMNAVIGRTMFQASQLCHSSPGGGPGERCGEATRLCKGARDLTAQVLYGMGILDAATDEAFRAKSASVLEGGTDE